MKFKFKNTLLVSFLAIAGILGVSSALINKQVNPEPVAEKAEADVTNGNYRINVFVDCDNWPESNIETYINMYTNSNQKLTKDSDLAVDSTYDNYNSVTDKDGNGHRFQTYAFSSRNSYTKNDTTRLGRSSAFWDGFGTGFNMYTQFRSNYWDNTISITGSWGNFKATLKGWYNKVRLYTGLDLDTTSYKILKSDASPSESDQNVPTGYVFEGWYTDSTLKTKWNNASGQYTDIKLYAKYIIPTYTINYDYVVDGVLQDKTITENSGNYNWGSLSKGSVSINTLNPKFSDLTDPTFYGCSFDGWYSNPECTTGLASTTITRNYTSGVYAKFTSNNTNNNYYLGIIGSTTNVNADLIVGNKGSWDSSAAAYTYVWYWNEGHTVSTVVKLREQLGISLDGWKFFSLHLPTTADSFLFCSGSWWNDNKYNQTITLDTGSGDTTIHASGKTLYAITDSSSSGSMGERKGRWVDSAYVLEVADNATFNSNLKSYPMMVPTESVVETNTQKSNVAQIMKTTISANKYVRGRYYFTVGNTLYESTAVTRGGDDGVSAYTQQAQVSSQNAGVKMLSEKTVNIYITSERKLYFVDCSGIEAAGFIYISTQYTPSQINVTCTVTTTDSGTLHPFNGEKLSSVTGHTYSTTLTYDGLKGMIMVPIYNLKKSAPKSTDTFAISLASASGSVNLTGVSILAEGTAEYLVVLDSGSTWSGDVAVSSSSDVAIAAYDIDRAIAAMQDKSVCSIDSATAKRLCDKYDPIISAGGDGKKTLEACTVRTWASSYGDDGADILLPNIRYQLGNIVGGAYRTSPLGSYINIFSIMGSESSFSTIIIVIASSVALLSVTALSILVIRKRKTKEQ